MNKDSEGDNFTEKAQIINILVCSNLQVIRGKTETTVDTNKIKKKL